MADKRIEWKRNSTGLFLKYTAHEFRRMLLKEGGEKISLYKVDAENKKHEFWQSDSLAIHLYSREVAFQKLKYIHNTLWRSTDNWLNIHVIINILLRGIMN